MKLIVEEEYGYKYWVWTVEGTADEIQKQFKKKTSCPDYYADRSGLGGVWEEVSWEEWRDIASSNEYDGFAHIHENHDSELNWNDERLDVR